MNQPCSHCGGTYHVSMGLFGIDETKTQLCPHCNELIYSSTGKMVVTEPSAATPVSSIDINHYSTTSHFSMPKSKNACSFQAKLLSFLSLFWLAAGSMALLLGVIYLGVLLASDYYFLNNVLLGLFLCLSGFLGCLVSGILFHIRKSFRDN